MTAPWFGAVADDVTGACDLADALCAAGSSAVVQCGVPEQEQPLPACDSAVVALKARTSPVERAVAESSAAARWLLEAGCTLLYQKYCSTFDSTDAGNIGPVADALRQMRGEDAVSVGTPATPRAQRTLYQGHLFVGRRLLSESSLRDHPLTPMHDPDLVAVLSRQTPLDVGLLPRSVVAGGVEAVRAAISDGRSGPAHLLVDAVDEADLDVVAAALLGLVEDGAPLLVGGAAGLGAALARARGTRGQAAQASEARAVPRVPAGGRLILSGSCSSRTREQVAAFPGPALELSPLALATDPAGAVGKVLAALEEASGRGEDPLLVSSSAAPDQVRTVEAELGAARAAELLETAMGRIARHAVETLGVRRILVAGGETSGAVVAALGLRSLRVGPAAAPGVPWMVPASGPPLALLLKSGNFGAPDLFTTAWEVCP